MLSVFTESPFLAVTPASNSRRYASRVFTVHSRPNPSRMEINANSLSDSRARSISQRTCPAPTVSTLGGLFIYQEKK